MDDCPRDTQVSFRKVVVLEMLDWELSSRLTSVIV